VTPYPAPPAPFDPHIETWPAGQTVWRCHPLGREGLMPNDTPSEARFRPIRTKAGDLVPTAYVAANEQVAIAEGPFHDLPISPDLKPLPRAVSDQLALTPLLCDRDLQLVSFRGHGLRRLGETQASLIEPGPGIYRASAAWGQAAYDEAATPDGIVWTARQFSAGAAMLLFWDRCGKSIRQAGSTLPLALGPGFELLCEAANAAGVVIVEP
jgi:RES domain